MGVWMLGWLLRFGFDLYNLLVAVVGAAALLVVYHALFRPGM
jgi:uncharacterized membrane protein YeaQ/YmgE (transglycosylase-associated protein family)